MFYENFIALCKARNEKPSPVLQALGVSKGNLVNWRNGTVPGIDVVSKIADYFDVSADSLLGKKIDPVREDEAKKLYELYSKLPPDAQKQVEGLMRTWVQSK